MEPPLLNFYTPHFRIPVPFLNTRNDHHNAEMEKAAFGKLAPELRNRIYELTLSHEDAIRDGAMLPDNPPNASVASHEWANRKTRHFALTQTCRAIRAESLQLYFARRSFILLNHSAWT